jgi:predicted Zn-dependent protease
MIQSESELRALVDRLFTRSTADEVAVRISSGTDTNLRFSLNSPSTSGHVDDTEVSITSTFGKRSATVSTNRLEALDDAVARSEELARLAPEDPERMAGLGPQSYAPIEAWKEPSPTSRIVEGVGTCIEDARAASTDAAGFARAWSGTHVLATKKGVFGRFQTTFASLSETVRTPTERGSGWASGCGRTWDDIDVRRVSTTAVDKALRSRSPRPLAPGDYPTILEPAAAAVLVSILLDAMDRRNADEGRSVFSKPGGKNRVGEKLFPEAIHLWSDPADVRCPVVPWGEDGLPKTRRDWIEGGVTKALPTGRYWAEKNGVDPIPSPDNFLMDGGTQTLEELVRGMKRGVLVTSFWYIRHLQPETLSLTGLTRDGVFWVEDGEIAYPVNNFRFNDSPVRMLQNVEKLGKPELVSGRGSSGPDTVVPPIQVASFHFASVSDAV